MITPDAAELARRIADLEDQVRALSTARQIARSTIEVDTGSGPVDLGVQDALSQSILAGVQLPEIREEIDAAQGELTQLQADLAEKTEDITQLTDDLAGLRQELAQVADDLTVSTAAPTVGDGTGKPTGALWFQEVDGSVVGAWRWDGTSEWTPVAYSDAVIGELDAAKIATGHLSADRILARSIGGDKIVANSIGADELAANAVTAEKIVAGSIGTDKLAANSVTAEKVVITDGANLFQSTYLLTGSGPVGLSSATPYSGALAPTGGRLIQLNARDHIADYRVPAKPGEEFYAEVVARRIAGTAALNPCLAAFTASGGVPTGMAGVWNTTMVRGTVMEDLGDGWVRASGIYKVPEAATDAALVGAFIQVEEFAPYTSQWIITDVVLRRRASGNLIVDGAITADKLAANAITGKTITGGTITGALIRTAASGQRMETASNRIRFFAANGGFAGSIIGVNNGASGGLLTLSASDSGDSDMGLQIGAQNLPAGGTAYVRARSMWIDALYVDEISGSGLPRIARGTTSTTANAYTTVTLPAGRFASAPAVVASNGSQGTVGVSRIVNRTATSFQVGIWSLAGAWIAGSGVDWIAVDH